MISEEKLLSLLDWTKQKINTEAQARAPFFKEREIWWAVLGENIGQEINGKNSQFERPIFILKKYSANKCFVLPVTTQLHLGLSDHFQSVCNGKKIAIVLSQGRTISSKRLLNKLGILSLKTCGLIVKRFQDQFKIQQPRFTGLLDSQ